MHKGKLKVQKRQGEKRKRKARISSSSLDEKHVSEQRLLEQACDDQQAKLHISSLSLVALCVGSKTGNTQNRK